MIHPTPNRLVRHRHSAFRQQIFDVAQAQGEPEVKPYRLLNDLGRETIPAVADLVHPRAATRPPRTPQARSAVTMPSGALLAEHQKMEDAANGGVRREPELPEHVAIVSETTAPAHEEFAIIDDEPEDAARQARVLRQQMRGLARQASLDPADGLEM